MSMRMRVSHTFRLVGGGRSGAFAVDKTTGKEATRVALGMASLGGGGGGGVGCVRCKVGVVMNKEKNLSGLDTVSWHIPRHSPRS